MTNLLKEKLSVEQLTEIFQNSPKQPLLPPLGDTAWAAVAGNRNLKKTLDALKAGALDELDQPLPELTPELYGDFAKTGVRRTFERLYFERRKRLARAAMATLVESDPTTRDKLLKSTLAKARSIFDEVSWSLPAHTGNDTGIAPMVIDLFAAETANLFGELLDLFGQHIAAPWRAEILKRLHEQFFQNYLDKKPWFYNAPMNWNAVCHQGVLGAALAVVDDPNLLARLFADAAIGLPKFLGGFPPDGASSEGPGYWTYGFGWFIELNAQLEQRTQKRLSLIEGDKHVHAIATYGPSMTLSNGFVVNFSDNSPRGLMRPSLLQYLADRLADKSIASHAAFAWRGVAEQGSSLHDQRADVFFFSKLLLRCPQQVDASVQLPIGDIFLPDTGVLVSRFVDDAKRLWEFAAKAGHNAEHHNHNDLGGYLLNVNGRRLLIEIGAPEYVRDLFREKRYEFLATRSLGHPVPLINGVEQPPGEQFRARITRHELEADHLLLVIDLTAAYPNEAGCRKCERTIAVDKKQGRLSITDRFELTRTESVETPLITESPVKLAEGKASITNGVTLQITPIADTQIREVQTRHYNDHSGKKTDVYRLVLTPTRVQENVTIGFEASISP